jgi:hypothetical protein
MADVVDITDRIKERNNLKAEKEYFNKHNEALDYLEEIFHGAILIEICKDGSINMSSTKMDSEETIDVLITAAFKVKDEMDKEK